MIYHDTRAALDEIDESGFEQRLAELREEAATLTAAIDDAQAARDHAAAKQVAIDKRGRDADAAADRWLAGETTTDDAERLQRAIDDANLAAAGLRGRLRVNGEAERAVIAERLQCRADAFAPAVERLGTLASDLIAQLQAVFADARTVTAMTNSGVAAQLYRDLEYVMAGAVTRRSLAVPMEAPCSPELLSIMAAPPMNDRGTPPATVPMPSAAL